jgi:hypothetical protein
MVISRLYAQICAEAYEKTDLTMIAVHKSAIVAQIVKTFGVLFDENSPNLRVSSIVDSLLILGDVAHIGKGYYIPRESRIVRLTHGWGHIAGGLPLEVSEHPNKGLYPVQEATIGRAVKLREDYAEHEGGAEYSAMHAWQMQSNDELYTHLYENLPEHNEPRSQDETILYYNPWLPRVHTRGGRWQNKQPKGVFIVAKTGNRPAHYYVYVQRRAQGGMVWCDVSNEDARSWILLAEKMAGAVNYIRVKGSDSHFEFLLPDMLPKAWASALCAFSSSWVSEEYGWVVQIQNEVKCVVEEFLRVANIKLL